MKIAVIMFGHLRAWDQCKADFMSYIYDENHQIDVFVNTYYDVFRTDYPLHAENEMNIKATSSEIMRKFDGINIVSFGVQPEKPALVIEGEFCQIRIMSKTVRQYEEYANENGKYDLVVKSRFDIVLDEKLDYERILQECTQTPNKIFIGNGAVHWEANDMLAVCNSDAFKIYGNRFNDEYRIHESMFTIKTKYGIVYDQSIDISILRLDGNRNLVKFK